MAEAEVAEERSGFDLRGLIVLVASGFVLFFLIISFISSGPMGPAHRPACQSNQHEIWMAISVFEHRKQRYPGWRTTLADRQVGWPVQLMPILGMNDQYTFWETKSGIPNTPGISLFVCPSDEQETKNGPWLSYGTNNGIADKVVSGNLVESKSNGLFFDHVVSDSNQTPLFISAAEVQKKDGLTQTLGLGENRRLYNWSGYGSSGSTVREYLTGFVWEDYSTVPSSSWLKFPINQIDTQTGTALTTTATNADAARISGPHGNVAIVTFADGHSVFLSCEIDYSVYNKLCTPNGLSVNQLPLEPAEYMR